MKTEISGLCETLQNPHIEAICLRLYPCLESYRERHACFDDIKD